MAYDRRGKLLSVGYNSYIKTHPLQAKFAKKAGLPQKIYQHAELAALIKARKKVHSLIVYRIGPDGKFMSSKPCAVCSEALRAFSVNIVKYS